ncbi:DUF2189 domain-containing protein [Amphritea balenae]|uniref:DUF2189 domain-containing protein n=1 Tax=Amphritea balenae TaxID=452629 RepID=A0A3P1SQI6_9GAMM|nr:DUF2189 domain-containing protein [Amphritea balenae]RRC99350.1 DUF2189 domain-containing protein [Amphritea balenae]GGK71845.1 hypothetical protein GCM10007941_22300 [Amphritea balenae]
MTEQTKQAIEPGVKLWLSRGWQDFTRTWKISVMFSSIFLVISLLAYWQLLQLDLGLVLYPFIAGFMVVAPLLVTGFQRVGRMLHEGEQPGFMDLLKGVRETTPGIFFLTFVLCVCYLIWVTDAMVIYGMYFGVKAVPINAELLADPVLRESLFSYLMFTGLMGFVIAQMGFMVGAFSIPLIMHQKMTFVAAVFTSVATVWRHKLLMFRWALSLALLMLSTLMLALPLLVVVLPVTAYASYEAYVDLLQQEDSTDH